MSTTENAVTAHLVVPDHDRRQHVLDQARELLHDRFHLSHATIQIDGNADEDCIDC